MMGKRQVSGTLFDVGNVFPFTLKSGSFHAQLAEAAPRLFPDENFAELYNARRGPYSVPPSELALMLLLQTQADCSDAEVAHRRHALEVAQSSAGATRVAPPGWCTNCTPVAGKRHNPVGLLGSGETLRAVPGTGEVPRAEYEE